MPIQITTLLALLPNPGDFDNPLKWKVSAEQVVIAFGVGSLLSLCLVIFIATMFQWFVSNLIIFFVKVLAWFCCLIPTSAVRYRRTAKKKKSIEIEDP